MQIYKMSPKELSKLGKPPKSFVLAPNNIVYNADLSMTARMLFLYYVGYRVGNLYPDGLVAKIMGVSVPTISRAKAELKNADVLYIKHLGGKNYIGFIANTGYSASEVYRLWKKTGEMPNEH